MQEVGIRQQQRAGHVVGQANAGEAARGGVVREGGRVNLRVDGFAQLQQGQLRAHLEGLLAGGERRCDEERARGRFVAALVCLRAFGVAHVHAVLLLQALL